jgi:enoyl-[acyl-carrier-protein] reductase (NADH)
MRDYSLGGTQVAFDAIETIRRQLAIDLGPHGVRVVTLASGGVPESIPDGFEGRGKIVEMIEGQTLLGRAATLEDVGNAAAFAASDWARSMTAAIVNVSCGALVDKRPAERTLPLCICDVSIASCQTPA